MSSSAPSPNPRSDADQLEAAVDQAIAACGGDAREAVKALIVANAYLETDLEKLKAAASMGYARGQLLPRDRKDWYDRSRQPRIKGRPPNWNPSTGCGFLPAKAGNFHERHTNAIGKAAERGCRMSCLK